MDKLFKKFNFKADFVTVYITDMHPTDGWHMEPIIDYAQPKTIEERKAACDKLIYLFNPRIPVVIDQMNNQLEKAYKALPERLYIIRDSKIEYVGGIGPFEYKID